MKSKLGIFDEDLDGDVDFKDYLFTDDCEENGRRQIYMDDLDFDEMNDVWDETDAADDELEDFDI